MVIGETCKDSCGLIPSKKGLYFPRLGTMNLRSTVVHSKGLTES